MPKKRETFSSILEKLALQELEYLSKLSNEERVRILNALITLKEREPRITEICQKEFRGESLTLDEVETLISTFDVYSCVELCKLENLERKAINIGVALFPIELRLLLNVAKTNPGWFPFEYEKRKAPPPPEVPKGPPEEALRKTLEVAEKKWRGPFPFTTANFIRSFLLYRKKEGAYAYEVWRAMKRALTGMISSEELRSVFKEARGIPVDGMIDHELVRGHIPTSMTSPVRHIPTYRAFQRYFQLLEDLALIARGKEEKSPAWKGLTRKRVYYAIVMEEKDSEMWKSPQKYSYPLSALGKKRWKKLLELLEEIKSGILTIEEFISMYAEELDLAGIYDYFVDLTAETITFKHLYVAVYVEDFKRIADERKLPYRRLLEMILAGEYK